MKLLKIVEYLGVIGVLVICVIGAFGIISIINGYEDHYAFVKAAPKINTTITVSDGDNFRGDIVDTRGRGYILDSIVPTIAKNRNYSITYYCNEHNKRMIIHMVDISSTPLDPYQCVTINGVCQ